MKTYYTNKNILITGGCGYLGSAILDAVSDMECQIHVLDREGRSLPAVEGKKAKIVLITGDIRDENIWKENIANVDIIFHLAAQTSSYVANDNPLEDVKINVLPVATLIETCEKENLRPDIILAGTATQVGLTTETTPINETHADDPVTVYDINKLIAEKYLKYYSRQVGGRSATLRIANLYGPGPASTSSDRGVLNKMVQMAINGEDLTIYGEGNFVRDYIFIDDMVAAFLFAGADIEKLNGENFVIGSGDGTVFKNMVESIQEQVQKKTGRQIHINTSETPKNFSPIEYRNFVADSSAFKAATGWKADVNLDEGIGRTIDFFVGRQT